ncbi:UDP-N-acetylmuramoyl-tripeptide--D-alanyl-D-alanine ligase [Microbacterium halophytorum]|uniref:UDP-N-acetylmuramoyl-tripeptide--D-alanyl-D- alanine ligase n=1 Tax=Microbacterium halophytorum TaxID=2067568 RepID=UPI000CFB2170|nr:UDP-N-acetylmuramoyl-tripeptide--D-alanyl-D-alanine ligase [Microbacterium halophytorum]
MIALSLAELAETIGGSLRTHGADTQETIVSGAVDTDSRNITAGGIFVAKPGEATDGHLFVGPAVANGAALAVVEREVDEPVSQIVVQDAVASLADLAREVVARVRAAGELQVVGVTGSNGKTTTKNMLAAVLREEGETVWPVASFNNAVGAPLTMLRVTERTRFLICEFGADAPGQIASLAGLVTPDIGIVLMVGLSHAGGFGGVEHTARAKRELVEAIIPGGTAVLNADDARVAAMASAAAERGVEVRWFGESDTADVRAEDVRVSASGTEARIVVDGEPFDIRLQVLGAHHVKNAQAALTAAVALGVDPAAAIDRLGRVELAERWRMQVMGNDRVRIINDAYNASPEAMQAALRTLAQVTGEDGRMVAVLGSMSELGERDVAEHQKIGLLAVRLRIPRIVVVGREARPLYLSAIAEGSWDEEAVFFETADEAYDYLAGELRDGDTVLVKSSNAAGLRLLGDRLGGLFS